LPFPSASPRGVRRLFLKSLLPEKMINYSDQPL